MIWDGWLFPQTSPPLLPTTSSEILLSHKMNWHYCKSCMVKTGGHSLKRKKGAGKLTEENPSDWAGPNPQPSCAPERLGGTQSPASMCPRATGWNSVPILPVPQSDWAGPSPQPSCAPEWPGRTPSPASMCPRAIGQDPVPQPPCAPERLTDHSSCVLSAVVRTSCPKGHSGIYATNQALPISTRWQVCVGTDCPFCWPSVGNNTCT